MPGISVTIRNPNCVIPVFSLSGFFRRTAFAFST